MRKRVKTHGRGKAYGSKDIFTSKKRNSHASLNVGSSRNPFNRSIVYTRGNRVDDKPVGMNTNSIRRFNQRSKKLIQGKKTTGVARRNPYKVRRNFNGKPMKPSNQPNNMKLKPSEANTNYISRMKQKK